MQEQDQELKLKQELRQQAGSYEEQEQDQELKLKQELRQQAGSYEEQEQEQESSRTGPVRLLAHQTPATSMLHAFPDPSALSPVFGESPAASSRCAYSRIKHRRH